MRVRQLVKYFTWSEEDRDSVTLGANTRLNPITNCAQLKTDSITGLYPTTANLFVKSRLTTMQNTRKWLGFEAITVHARDDLGAPLTSCKFRLDDGVGEFYWDGAVWAAAGAGNWNTEQEIADHIATFDAVAHSQKLRIVANLATTDARYTPQLVEARVLFESAIDFHVDILYRSLIPLMKAKIRPISEVVLAMPATGATLNKTDIVSAIETGYDIVDVDAVFDYTAQGARAKNGVAPNLLLSYNTGTGLITLTGSVAAATSLWIRFIYSPEIAVTTSQDWIAPERIPALTLTEPLAINMSDAPDSGISTVTNKAARTAVVVPAPQQGDLEFTLLGVTDKAVDQLRLQEQVNAFFANNPILISAGLDEGYRLHLLEEYATVGEPGQAETHIGKAVFRILNFKRWLRDSYTDNVVTNALTLVTSSS